MKTPSHLRILSLIMINLCWLAIVAFPLFQIWFWLFNANKFDQLKVSQFIRTDFNAISDSQIMLALTISLLGALIISYGLWRLLCMFKQFLEGKFFSATAISHLYTFTLVLLISLVYKIIQTGALSATLTWHNSAGQRQLALNFGAQDLAMVFLVGLLFSITWCFREAHRLDAENKEFV